MLYFLKIIFSAAIILAVTEISKRSSTLAAFTLALPLVSILAFIWMYIESKDAQKIAAISYDTCWYVLPTLPMFLLFSWMLRQQYTFYLSLLVCCLLTALLFGLTQFVLGRQAN